MAAEYLATLERLTADRETYLGAVPGDIIGLLRDLYPSSISLETATAEIDAAFQQRLRDAMAMLPRCSVRVEHLVTIHEDYVNKLTQVPYLREFLRREAAAKNKMRWWLSIFKNVDEAGEDLFFNMYRGTELEAQIRFVRWGETYYYDEHPEAIRPEYAERNPVIFTE